MPRDWHTSPALSSSLQSSGSPSAEPLPRSASLTPHFRAGVDFSVCPGCPDRFAGPLPPLGILPVLTHLCLRAVPGPSPAPGALPRAAQCGGSSRPLSAPPPGRTMRRVPPVPPSLRPAAPLRSSARPRTARAPCGLRRDPGGAGWGEGWGAGGMRRGVGCGAGGMWTGEG